MELWKVKVSWRSPYDWKEWNKKVNGVTAPPPPPDRREGTTYVAVHGAFGADQIAEAGKLAIAAMVGDVTDDTKINEWQPLVEAAEWVATVAVQKGPQ